MTHLTPTPTLPYKRNTKLIVIASVVIAIVVIGAVAGTLILNPSLNPLGPPFDFGITLSDSSGTTIQGSSLQTTVYLSKTNGNAQTVTLNADSGSSGIQCSFSPSSNTPDYSSALTIAVPANTHTGVYSVTITASGGGKTYSTSYAVSVLSAKVYVSGTVETTGLGTHPSRIEFVDTQSGVTYTGSLSGTSYQIQLDNQHTYSVTVTWEGLLWSTGTYSGGNVYVYAPVGESAMTKSFSG